jgi:hypothetical protein
MLSSTKYVAIGVCVLLGLSACVTADELSANATDSMTPVNRVLNLIRELEKAVEKDGKMEQKSYDKYACWCESTLERKAKDISDAKVKIDKLSKHILNLKGDLGAHSQEIASLKKWIAENLASQKEATEVRDKENADFEAEKTENEQCTGALESAIKVLTGAGTFAQQKASGFLQHDAQLLGIASDLRRPQAGRGGQGDLQGRLGDAGAFCGASSGLHPWSERRPGEPPQPFR